MPFMRFTAQHTPRDNHFYNPHKTFLLEFSMFCFALATEFTLQYLHRISPASLQSPQTKMLAVATIACMC